MQTENEQVLAEEELNDQPKGKKEKEPTNWKKELISWILTLAVAVAVALPVRAFVFEPVRVDGESMCDTLQDGEVMIVTKPEYLMGDPEFGDVIICHYPNRGNTNFVKRVMGVPGDVISIINNMVYRNGEKLDEPYLTPSRNNDGFSMAPFELGDGEFFVMGDNRDNSHDSRNYYSYSRPSAITRDMIVGKVRWVVFPFTNIRGIE